MDLREWWVGVKVRLGLLPVAHVYEFGWGGPTHACPVCPLHKGYHTTAQFGFGPLREVKCKTCGTSFACVSMSGQSDGN